jgi:hypothetical protein
MKHPINIKNKDLENLERRIPNTEYLENKAFEWKTNPAYISEKIQTTTQNNQEDQFQNTYHSTDSLSETNRLYQLEKDREFLILKNLELENEINKLDNIFSKTIQQSTPNPNNKSKQQSVNKNQPTKQKQSKSLTIAQENVILKKKLHELETTITNLENKIENLNKHDNSLTHYAPKINDSDIKKEIKLWKERTQQLTENYLSTLKALKEELNKDKVAFKTAITNIKNQFNSDLKSMYNSYNNQMVKNEKKLAMLIKENNDLKRKEEKVKEVYMYNFK